MGRVDNKTFSPVSVLQKAGYQLIVMCFYVNVVRIQYVLQMLPSDGKMYRLNTFCRNFRHFKIYIVKMYNVDKLILYVNVLFDQEILNLYLPKTCFSDGEMFSMYMYTFTCN